MTPQILCGFAGWANGGSSRRLEALEQMAERFDVAEIGLSFREMPKPELTTLWARRTSHNPAFQFTAKLHSQFTHDRVLEATAVREFKQGLRPLANAGKLGCVLMQFPWSFKFNADNRAYLIQLRRTFPEFPLVAEMRHESWSVEEALGSLIDYKLGFCNIDQPEYKRAMPPTSYLTSGIGYVRLHGRNCFRWFSGKEAHKTARYDYLYSEEELAEWKTRIERIAGYSRKTFVVFNNDEGPKSLANAAQLQAMLRGEPVSGVLKKLRKHAQGALFTQYSHQSVA